jgi:hypothetical protein
MADPLSWLRVHTSGVTAHLVWNIVIQTFAVDSMETLAIELETRQQLTLQSLIETLSFFFG